MEMSGSALVPASQQETWVLLNEPEVLKDCISGCESIEQNSDSVYQVAMVAKAGPISARFKGQMSLTDLNPPNSYSIDFAGQGGPAGFAKGRAKIELVPEDDMTRLNYVVSVQVGGKLAQLGARLINGAAKKAADEFFSAFCARLHSVPKPEKQPPEPACSSNRLWLWLWILSTAAALVALYFTVS